MSFGDFSRNTPNMSYCQFQNTQAAMEQCLTTLSNLATIPQERWEEFEFDITESERVALTELRDLCENFVEIADDFLNQ